MNVGAIDTGRIQSMLAQLRAASNVATPDFPGLETKKIGGISTPQSIQNGVQAPKIDFAAALRSSLDQVNLSQKKADEIGKSFALGNDNVSLSDVMIAGQKASISFQATVQVRNKLVSAYHDIMNMQV